MKERRVFSNLSMMILLVGVVLLFDLVVVSAIPLPTFNITEIRGNLDGIVPGIDNTSFFPRGDLYTATKLCELLTLGLGNESIPSGFPSDSFGNMPVINNTAGLCDNNTLVYWDKGASSWVNASICSGGQPYSYILDLSCRLNVSGEVSPLDSLNSGDLQVYSIDEIKAYYASNSPIKLFNGSENFAVNINTATDICSDLSGGSFPYLHYMIGRGFVNCGFNFSYYINSSNDWSSVGDVCDYTEVAGEYSFIENGSLTCAKTPSACVPDCSGRVCGPDPNCGVACEAEGFTCEASGGSCNATTGQCFECAITADCAVGVCSSGICVYNYWSDMNGVKLLPYAPINIFDFVRMVSNVGPNYLVRKNGADLGVLSVNYYFANLEGQSYVPGDPYNYSFNSSSGSSENIINVTGVYEDSPLSVTLLSPSCGDYFDMGSEQTITVYINDSDDRVSGNITVDGVYVRDIDNFVDNVVTFNHTFTTAGNSHVVVEVNNLRGESFKASVNVMVASKTDFYVAACIDEPGSLDRVFNASSVFFNASSSKGLKYNVSEDSYTNITKEKLVFTWKFTFGTGRDGDSCVGLGLNGHCPGTNAPIYAFSRLFPTVNNNRVFLSVSIPPNEMN